MLSIVIPTRNRGLFLERLLSYYKEQDLQEPILIADSSNPNERTQVTRAVEAAGKHLNMDYRYYGSDIGIAEKLSEEELAVFDLLTKPEISLTKKEQNQVKKVARELLETL